MKRIVIGVTLLALLLGLVVVVQGATSKSQQVAAQVATEYLQELLRQIKFAQKVDIQKLIPEIKGPILIPEGLINVGSNYAMCYQDDPAYHSGGRARHTFGWYSESVGCGALYPLVYGDRFKPCSLAPDTSASMPWGGCLGKVNIPDHFGTVGFWLNWAYPPTGSVIATGGLYFTNPGRNWDGIPHAYVFHFVFPFPISVVVECDGGSTTMTVHEVYVITWEDWCHGGDNDQNDFLVALFH